jgi:DNA-binding NarL/FixJ family response regulator
VLVAERYALVRAGIRLLVERIDNVDVVGEAEDGSEVFRLIEELRPNLVLFDIELPGMSAFELLKRCKTQFPEVRVIVVGAGEGTEASVRSLRAGAAGYLTKTANSAELDNAIAAVARGEVYVSRAASKDALIESATQELLARLSPRQREVLVMIASGGTTKAIAHSLKISPKTVESHRAQLMERLEIHDVAGLVRLALRAGLIAS